MMGSLKKCAMATVKVSGGNVAKEACVSIQGGLIAWPSDFDSDPHVRWVTSWLAFRQGKCPQAKSSGSFKVDVMAVTKLARECREACDAVLNG